MLTKKVCLLGSYSVGKTSLVARFVQSVFSEKYLTTVGVKIDKKVLAPPGGGPEMTLMLWDLAGEDEFQKMQMSYLRGAAGFLYVADGTRPASLDKVRDLHQRVTAQFGPLPHVLALNKADLEDEWQIEDSAEARLAADGWRVRRTSAKLASGVEETFGDLAGLLVQNG